MAAVAVEAPAPPAVLEPAAIAPTVPEPPVASAVPAAPLVAPSPLEGAPIQTEPLPVTTAVAPPPVPAAPIPASVPAPPVLEEVEEAEETEAETPATGPATGAAPAAEGAAETIEAPPAEEVSAESLAEAEEGAAAATDEATAGEAAGPAAESAEAPAEEGAAAPAADVELLMPEPPAGLSPATQERIGSAQGGAGRAASAHAEMPPAAAAVEEARGAVTEPPEEVSARAEAGLVEALGARPSPSPEIEELCQRIYEVIRSKRPPDEDSLVNARPEQMAQAAGAQMNESVEGDAQRVQGSYDQLEQPPAGEPSRQPDTIESPPESAETPAINAAAAAPDAIPAENVSLDADVEANRQRMQDAGMASEPAQLVQSGPIAEAREAQGELEQTAQQSPAQVLAQQEESLTAARGDMAALQQSAVEALAASRRTTVSGTLEQQTQMVGSEEQMRARVSAQAAAIFATAQQQVNSLLQPLPQNAMNRWTTGVAVLSTEFSQSLARVKAWIDERHSGFGGALTSAWDALTGLPDWVEEEYDRAEQRFGDGVCNLIREISTEVNGIIMACEAIIDTARAQITALFATLPASLQAWAAEEQNRLNGQLNGLQQRAVETRDNFNRDLIQRASESVQEVRQQVHELREQARGLLGRALAAIDRFLEDPAKFIIEGLLELVGIPPASFWALVDKIGQVINDIADDPIGFANNMVTAIGQGFQQFFENFATHIMGGFFDWLFSGLGAVGVTIPTDFSLQSIITFALQLMGITWPRIREVLARHIGEENVALLEQAYELISTLIEQGPEGIFEMIKEQLNPQTILDQILQAAVDFLIQGLISAVTPRIIALFNPAGAIIQAIELIYRILSWIFNNAARIFSLIETVVNGAADLVAGNTSGMATAVEGALARLIAPVIDFLAGYLGLGNLPEQIADTIRGFQDWVLGIIDRVVAWLAERARALLRALGVGGEEEEAEGEEPGDHSAMIRAAIAELEQPAENADDYESVRQVKEAQAQQIENRYSEALEEGVGMSIAFADPAADTVDQDLDFTVTIAPNTDTGTGSTPLPVPEPVAGLHVVQRPAGTPAASVEESHHVPAVGLGHAIAQFLSSIANELQGGIWSNEPDAQAISNLFAARAQANENAASRRTELSAILLASEAHTERGGVHTIEGTRPVLDKLATDPREQVIVLVKRKTASEINNLTSYLAVNPRIPSWRLFLADVRRALMDPQFRNNPDVPPQTVQAATLILDQARQEFIAADALLGPYLSANVVNPTNRILDRAVGDAYQSGKSVVAAAMERAQYGTPEGRSSALSSLDGYFRDSWQPFRERISV